MDTKDGRVRPMNMPEANPGKLRRRAVILRRIVSTRKGWENVKILNLHVLSNPPLNS